MPLKKPQMISFWYSDTTKHTWNVYSIRDKNAHFLFSVKVWTSSLVREQHNDVTQRGGGWLVDWLEAWSPSQELFFASHCAFTFASMQGAPLTTGSNLGFSIFPKDTWHMDWKGNQTNPGVWWRTPRATAAPWEHNLIGNVYSVTLWPLEK